MRKAVLALALLLCLVARLPQAQASSVEKFPTDNHNNAGFWYDAIYGRERDYSYAYCVASEALNEEDYTDFNFSIPEDASIDCVLVGLTGWLDVNSPQQMFEWIDLEARVFNGSEYHVASFLQEAISVTGSPYFVWEAHSDLETHYIDVTDFLDTANEINQVEIRLRAYYQGGMLPSPMTVYVDSVSVKVAYTTPTTPTESEFPVGVGAGALLMGFVAVIAFSIKKKR